MQEEEIKISTEWTKTTYPFRQNISLTEISENVISQKYFGVTFQLLKNLRISGISVRS